MDNINNVTLLSVLFTDIVGYSKLVNSEQIKVKKSFIDMWNKSLVNVKPEDIVVIDTGDGAILASLSDPELPLKVGLSLKSQIKDSTSHLKIALRMGIHFGPVEIANDMNGNKTILGDGINSGQRIMSFSYPGQILVSRPYYELIKPLAYHYKDVFSFAGNQADKHNRYHELYKYLDDEIIEEQEIELNTKIAPKKSVSLVKRITLKTIEFFIGLFDLFKTVIFKMIQLGIIVGIIYEAFQIVPLLPNVDLIQYKFKSQYQYLINKVNSIKYLNIGSKEKSK